jgi:hypothetical protein
VLVTRRAYPVIVDPTGRRRGEPHPGPDRTVGQAATADRRGPMTDPAPPADATVLIVDDHELVATSLVLGLGAEGIRARHRAPGGDGYDGVLAAAAGPRRAGAARPRPGPGRAAPPPRRRAARRAAAGRRLARARALRQHRPAPDRRRAGGGGDRRRAEGGAVPAAARRGAGRAGRAPRDAGGAAPGARGGARAAGRGGGRAGRAVRAPHPARAGGAGPAGRGPPGPGGGGRVRGLAGHGAHADPVDLRQAGGHVQIEAVALYREVQRS